VVVYKHYVAMDTGVLVGGVWGRVMMLTDAHLHTSASSKAGYVRLS